MFKLLLLLSLGVLPTILLSAPAPSHPGAEHLFQKQASRPSVSKRFKKTFFKKRKKDKEPFSILGYEPFTAIGLVLILGGIFVAALLPLGILALLFGFVRYRKIHPGKFKGDEKHLEIFLAGLIAPVLIFLGIHATKGRP